MDPQIRTRPERPVVLQLLTDPHLWVISLLPIVVLCISSNWIFSPSLSIDPWVYHGFFRNLVQYKTILFPGTYYGSRLSWILPGYVLHKLLTPSLANYVLHLTFLYAVLYSLYYAVRISVHRQAALVTSVFLGTYTFFLWPIGSDYVDGPANTFLILSLAFLTAAARKAESRLALPLSGVFFAATVYTNLFTIIFSPVVALYFGFLFYRSRGLPGAGEVVRSTALVLGGGLTLTAVLACANYLIEGTFLFYLPSISYALASAGQPNPWKAPVEQWIGHADWLLMPLVVAVAGLVALGRRWFRTSVAGPAAVWAFLLTCFLMLLCEWKGIPVLQYSFYASYLLPAAFLALGALLEKPLQDLRESSTLFLALGVIVVNTIPLWGYNSYLAQLKSGSWPAAPLLFGVVFAACGALNTQATRWSIIAALLACNLTTVSVGYSFAGRHDVRHEFARVSQSAAVVDAVRRGEAVRFWYSSKDPHFPEFNALNSIYLWGYTMIGNEFPAILPAAVVSPGALWVIPSSADDVLPAANEALRSKDLLLELVDRRQIRHADTGYTLWFVRVGFDFSKLRLESIVPCETGGCSLLVPAAGARRPELPLNHWVRYEHTGPSVSFEQRAGGVRVTKAPAQYAYSAKYGPLVARESGRRVFRLRYRLLSGGISLGALSGDGSRWLVAPSVAGGLPGDQTAVLSLQAEAGEPFWLMISNHHPDGDRPSAYDILGLEAYRFPAAEAQPLNGSAKQ